jgi:hypothetical protein
MTNKPQSKPAAHGFTEEAQAKLVEACRMAYGPRTPLQQQVDARLAEAEAAHARKKIALN